MEVGGWSDVGCVDEDKAVFVELELGNNCGIGKAAINEESVAGGTNRVTIKAISKVLPGRGESCWP